VSPGASYPEIVSRKPVPKDTVCRQLLDLGVQPGGVLLVHTSFRATGPIEGGPTGLIEALRQALGPDGTLVMPSMTYADNVPFDPTATPCTEEMGVLADAFWRTPGVLRSPSHHAFAAIGPHAATITQPHSHDIPHGPDSPVGRVHDLGGQVLLIGVGHDSNTTIHLAEAIAAVRYRIPKSLTILEDGALKTIDYGETDHCCQNFSLLDDWLDDKQRTGTVGHATARLARSRDIVEAAVTHLHDNETVFLHPLGVDEECDEARASIPA